MSLLTDERSRLPQLGRLRGTLAGTAGGAFGITVAGMGIRFVSQVLFARWLGVLDFGRVVYALNWTQVLAPGATLGYSSSVMAFMPAYDAKDDWCSLRGIVRRSRQVTLVVGVLVAAVAYGVIVLQHGPLDLALLLGFLCVPLMGLVVLHQAMFRALRRTWMGDSITMLVQPIAAMLGVGAVLLAIGRLSATHVLVIFGLSILLVVALQAWVLHRSFPPSMFSAAPRYNSRAWTRTSLALFLSAMFQRVVNAADVIMVGIFLGPTAAGLYGAASRLADLGSLVLAVVGSIVAPTISASYAQEDYDRLQKVVTTGVRLAFWPSLVGVAGMIALSKPLLSLFGEPFTQARDVLILLALGNLVNAATGPCTYLLGLTGRERRLATIVGVNAGLNLALGVVLIPRMGMKGAAVASMVTMISYNVLVAGSAKRLMGIRSYLVPKWGRGGRVTRQAKTSA